MNSGIHFTRFPVDDAAMGDSSANTTVFNPRLTTADGRQYLAYWAHDGGLNVAERSLPDGAWDTTTLDVSIHTRDAHYAPALGVGPDGHLFICYNTRDTPILWRRSTAPARVSEFGEEREGMTGKDERSACYPEFTLLQEGRFLFGYREGSSGDGDWHLNRWDSAAETWRPLQHPLTDGEGDRNAYHWNLVRSDDGRIHYFFCWRNNDREGIGNTDLCYARSSDGGDTWERSDGTAYTVPIRKGDAEIVDAIDFDHRFQNQGWASVDPRTGAPHVAYYRNDAHGATQLYHGFRERGSWVVEPITDRRDGLFMLDAFSRGGTGPKQLARPAIVVESDGTVRVVSRDTRHGSWPLVFTKRDGTWSVDVLYRRNFVRSELHIDRERWAHEQVLSVVDQAQSSVGGAPWASATQLGVTDIAFDSEAQGHGPPDVADMVEFASDGLGDRRATVSEETFQTIPMTLSFAETTVPATPVFARLTLTVDVTGGAECRLRIDDTAEALATDQSTLSPPLTLAAGRDVWTTPWTPIPDGIRAGQVLPEIRTQNTDGLAELLAGVLELGYRDPRPSLGTLPA